MVMIAGGGGKRVGFCFIFSYGGGLPGRPIGLFGADLGRPGLAPIWRQTGHCRAFCSR